MKVNGKRLNNLNIKYYILSLIVGMLILIVINAIGSLLITSEKIQSNTEGYITMISTLAASYASASLWLVKWKRNKLIGCGTSACGLFCVLLTVNGIVTGANYNGVGVTILIILCGSAIAALPKKKSEAEYRKFKY